MRVLDDVVLSRCQKLSGRKDSLSGGRSTVAMLSLGLENLKLYTSWMDASTAINPGNWPLIPAVMDSNRACRIKYYIRYPAMSRWMVGIKRHYARTDSLPVRSACWIW